MTRSVVQVRVSGEEKEAWWAAAREDGLPMSLWLRRLANKAAGRRVEGADLARRVVRAAVADFVPADEVTEARPEPAARKPKRQRTETCEHRIPPEAHCWKCDE